MPLKIAEKPQPRITKLSESDLDIRRRNAIASFRKVEELKKKLISYGYEEDPDTGNLHMIHRRKV